MSSGAAAAKEEKKLFLAIMNESKLESVEKDLGFAFAKLRYAVRGSNHSMESLARIAKLGQTVMCLAHMAQWNATQEIVSFGSTPVTPRADKVCDSSWSVSGNRTESTDKQ